MKNFKYILGSFLILAVSLASCEDILFEEDISDSVVFTNAPKNNAIVKDSIVNFSWNPVEFATQYQLQIATPDFVNTSQIIVDSTFFENDSINSSYNMSFALLPNVYEWRIMARNANSHTQYSTEKFKVEFEVFTEDISDKTVIAIAPSENATLDIKEINFSWEELEFAENYKLQIATPNFDNPLQVVVDETLTETTAIHTIENGNYQWRIKAKNSTSETPYTTTSFIVDALTFDEDISNETVAIVAPIDGAVLETNTINFTWEPVEFAEDYKIQIATPDFNNTVQVVVDEVLAGTTSTQTLEDGDYQWRIKARNSESETGYTIASFSVQSNGDDLSNKTVTLIAPIDGAMLTNNELNFTWEAVTNADEYIVQIATPDFTNPIQVVVDETLTTTTATHTLIDGSYQWRVKAKNATSQTPYTTSSFTIETNIAFSDREVVILSPVDNFVSNQSVINIQWETVEDATFYRIQVLDATSSALLDEQTTTQTNIPFTFPEGNLIWQVRAETSSESTQYTSQNITVDTVPPNTPTLLTPLDAEILTSTSVTFTWDRIPIGGTPEMDTLYVYLDSGLTNQVLQEEVTNGTFTTTLSSNETYYWYMKAFDEAGNESDDSSVFSFTIN